MGKMAEGIESFNLSPKNVDIDLHLSIKMRGRAMTTTES